MAHLPFHCRSASLREAVLRHDESKRSWRSVNIVAPPLRPAGLVVCSITVIVAHVRFYLVEFMPWRARTAKSNSTSFFVDAIGTCMFGYRMQGDESEFFDAAVKSVISERAGTW